MKSDRNGTGEFADNLFDGRRKAMRGFYRSRPEAEEKQAIAVLRFCQDRFPAGIVRFVIMRF